MVRIGDLIPDAARGLGLEDELRLSRAMATFEALVAERVPAAAGRLPGGPARGVRARCRGRRADRRPGAAAAQRRAAERLRGRPGRASARANCGSTSAAEVPAYNPGHLPATSEATDRGRSRRQARSDLVRPSPRPRIAGPARSREARMAVRLQMKLGVVAEHDRLADSPDTLVVVEPSVGSVARSKGHLYLLVTSRISSRHALEATRLAAETIRNEYYYDESAGIRVCLQKAIATANKRLAHQADRLGLKIDRRQRADRRRRGRRPRQRDVRGDGRAGRGLPDPPGAPVDAARPAPRARPARRATSSPTSGAARSRSATRSSSSRPTSSPSSAPTSSRTRCSTLHPQSAMEHLHHRFVAADGSGSDGAIAFEATEVSSTSRARTLVPVRPAEPLAGAPDRSPIPLADNVQAAGVAVSAAAGNARIGGRRRHRARRRPGPGPHAAPQAGLPAGDAAGVPARDPAPGGAGGPRPGHRRRRPRARPSTPSVATRRRQAISSVNAGQKALDQARADLAKVTGPGIDLVDRRPDQALELLTDAHQPARRRGRGQRQCDRHRAAAGQVEAGLDRLYGVVPVASTDLSTFKPAEGAAPFDLRRDGPGSRRRPVRHRSRRPRPSTGSTSRPRRPRSSCEPGTKNKRGTVATRASWASAARTC